MAAGKVCTGFSMPYVAKYSATGGTVTYSEAMRLARGVSVTIDPEVGDDNKFFADNITAEVAPGTFTGGTATLTVDGIQEALWSAGIGFRLNSVQYEDDTNLIHYEWEFWVA